MKCLGCGSKDFRRHSFRRNKDEEKTIQRYKCKKCGKTQSEHKVTYTKTEKRLLSMLINFLENDLESLTVKEHLEESKEYNYRISNIVIESCKTKGYEFQGEYSCNLRYIKPRLIICEARNGIKLIKIPSEALKKDFYDFYFRLS